ncbi:MAG: pyruvate, phosphate dikinase [Paracoccaceae bacterium]
MCAAIIPLAEIADAARHGAKARRLAMLIAAGAPAPPGFAFPDDVEPGALAPALIALGRVTGAGFGAASAPLLLALRSSPVDPGAASSPAILNLGLTRAALPALAKRVGRRAALDLRRRLIQSFAAAAMDADPEAFENALYDRMKLSGTASEEALTEEALVALEADYLAAVEDETGEPFPEDAAVQLALAIAAMRRAWAAPTARMLRQARGVEPGSAQALIAQAMALGLGPAPSGAGVATGRAEDDGAPGFHGRFLAQAQGEDALMGLRTPRLLTESARLAASQTAPSLEADAPEAAAALAKLTADAERALADACRIEFTLEAGKLFILDAQPLKPTARGAVRIAVDLAEAGVISRNQALLRVDPSSLTAHLHHSVAARARRDVIGKGLPASPGAATGVIVFSPEAAEALAAKEEGAILVRVETSPEDIRGMLAASGVLTVRGGMTSHAAVIARGLGAPCVVGAGDIQLDLEERLLTAADGRIFREGDIITIDGSAGEALVGAPELVRPQLSGAFATLMGWADSVRRLKVRANADTGQDARVAIGFNVDGIGLCRTEHMFFAKNRITSMRRMILAADEGARRAALEELLPMQRDDFSELFEIMAGLPVTIRLLDPPLHEFLPHGRQEMSELADAMGLPLKTVTRRAEEMKEFNPMLGKRGCRVGVAFPEIYEMQARAVFEAAVAAGAKTGEPVTPEIMIPFVSANREMELLAGVVERVAEMVRAETGVQLRYRIGAMVETPRAALRAGDIASTAEFLSFGTNDLTQMTYGLSRDDAGRFMREYVAKGVFPEDPFHSLDVEGVGELLLLAAERGRRRTPGLTLGLCGEHGGDPASIRFCELAGFDYISCSPFRLPIARLAAAQARLLSSGVAGGDSL